MKNLFCILMSCLLVLSFAACKDTTETLMSSTDQGYTDTTVEGEKDATTEKVEEADQTVKTDTVSTTQTQKTKKTRKPTTTRTVVPTQRYTLPNDGTRVTATMKTLAEENKVRFLGRTYTYAGEDTRRMVFGNTGFQLEGTLSGYVSMRVNVQKNCCAINITVDGKTRTEWVDKGSATVTLADDLAKGKHTITVTKGTAHHAGELTVETVSFAGTLTTPAPEKLQIEFIGDSVTVGEGMYGKQSDFPSLAQTYNTYDGYAAKVARNLGAGVSTLATCGSKVPGMRSSFLEYGWDFANNHKDIVVINMGTNDLGWSNISLSSVEATLRPDCTALIKAVREKYGKDTYIVWAYGMMFDKDKAFFKDVTEQYAKNNNDNRVLFCDLSAAKDNAGNASHPSTKGNDKAAEILTQFLKDNCI